MRVFLALCIVFMEIYRCAQGSTWRHNFDEAVKNLNEEDLRKVPKDLGSSGMYAYYIPVHEQIYVNHKEFNFEDPDLVRAETFQHPPFQCPDMSPSPSVPTSVELVKAADIKVIAALGDSLTAAFAANASSILEVPTEYRHISWSIGGHGSYQDVITLANIVKLFNPNVLGPASMWTVSGTPAPIEKTGFNLAVSGANSLNFSEQTRNMINTLKNYSAINFTEDWKLVTVLIGMNDICDHCKNKTLFSVDNFINHITESLQMMMDEVPRLIVNIVQILTMKPLREVRKPTQACQLQKKFCSCLVLPADNSTELKELVELNQEFQLRLEELIHSGRFFKDDFAVVLQPYLSQTDVPKVPTGEVDFSFFAPDCFHFSVKTHEAMAKGLWNNMFQSEGSKGMISNLTEPVNLICPPQEHPYIYTRPRALSSAASQGQVFLTLLTLMSSLILVFGY